MECFNQIIIYSQRYHVYAPIQGEMTLTDSEYCF